MTTTHLTAQEERLKFKKKVGPEDLALGAFIFEEGTKLMEGKELFISEVRPGIFLLDEAHGATGYLVVGEKQAALIDTMMGFTDLKEVTKKLTDKPIVVINTHGHPDHIYGNCYFDKAFLNPRDYELADMFFNDPEFLKVLNQMGGKVPPFRPLNEGDEIDLGGRTLKAYLIPGHTLGSMLLLLKEDRVLFTGDAINHHLWLQLDGCLTIEECIKTLNNVMFLEKEADIILHGHAQKPDDISLMHCLRSGLQEIVEGKVSEDKPYEWFGGVDLQHPFKCEEGKLYSSDAHVICYKKDNVYRK